jgi:hypothetical protein
MRKWNTISRIKRASEIARKRANIRWQRDRDMREKMAALDPIKFEGRIIKRIVVIENEATAKEICFYDFDRYSDRKRKLNQVRAIAFV